MAAQYAAAQRRGGVAVNRDYELGMLLAAQTAAPAWLHSADAEMTWSLMTVDAMFVEVTHVGVRREAGSVEPGPLAGLVVPLIRAAGGVRPARRIVATATASWA